MAGLGASDRHRLPEPDVRRMIEESSERTWQLYHADRPDGMDVTSGIHHATVAHAYQTDKNGLPYIFHPLRVAERLSAAGEPEWLVVCGALHDVLEDTRTTIYDLMNNGINRRQREVLELLTHPKHEPYLDYIYRIGDDRDAATAKIADIKDNLQLWRLQRLTAAQRDRAEKKYPPALQYLEGRVLFGLSHEDVVQRLDEAQGGSPWRKTSPKN